MNKEVINSEGLKVSIGKDFIIKEKELKTVTIIINGRPRIVSKKDKLTFEELIIIAFENPQTGAGIGYTIQYSRGDSGKPSGFLVEGQSVKAKEGMEFDVTSTNRS